MITALLVRWSGGWRECTDPAAIAARGRSEALLGLGATQSAAEVDRIARVQLTTYADVRTAITAAPTDTTVVPGLGDRVTLPNVNGASVIERVISRTFSEDDDGTVTFAADISDVILTSQQRWEQAIKKMSDGTIRGDSKVATPVSQIGGTGPVCCVPQPPGGDG